MDNFFINICIGVLILAMIAVPIVAIKSSQEFKDNNCIKTSETRTLPITNNIIVGKSIIPVTSLTTQHKYTCDDQVRWR